MRLLIIVLSTLVFSHTLCAADSTRIIENTIYDQGLDGPAGFTIDTRQIDCDPEEEEEDLESFFDTILGIRVINNLNREIRFTGYKFRMSYRDESGNRVRVKSKRIGISGKPVVAGFGESEEILVLLFDKKEMEKGIPNQDIIFPEDLGFRTIRIVLFGRTEDGRRTRLRSRFTASIDAFDRCS